MCVCVCFVCVCVHLQNNEERMSKDMEKKSKTMNRAVVSYFSFSTYTLSISSSSHESLNFSFSLHNLIYCISEHPESVCFYFPCILYVSFPLCRIKLQKEISSLWHAIIMKEQTRLHYDGQAQNCTPHNALSQ